MATKQTSDILKWARLGAVSRLRELEEEQAAIVAAFPGLAGKSAPAPRTRAAAADGAGSNRASVPALRKRRKLSPAARKRISDAQKRRWAAHRAGKS